MTNENKSLKIVLERCLIRSVWKVMWCH